MPDASLDQDINFQPETKGFSYSSGPAEKKKKLRTFFTLLFIFIILPLIFFFTLGILNYFNIISLSSISPQISKNLPKATPTPAPFYDQEAKNWTLEGFLYGYNNYDLKIKFHNQTINFKFEIGESQFYTKRPTSFEDIGTESADLIQILGFFSDLQKQENIGKKVTVTYTKNKNENIIQTIILE